MKFCGRLFTFFLTIAFALLFTKGWHLLTGGFRLEKIKTNLHWQISVKETDNSKILPVLEQKFKYLSKGCQVYVFESEDKKYVIKFLRQSKYWDPFWLNSLTFGYKGEKCREHWQKGKRRSVLKGLKSYKISFEKLPEETGVVYAHLNKTSCLQKTVALIDFFGREHVVNLDEVVFVLQKKGQILEDELESIKQDNVKLKKFLEEFVKLEKKLWAKGFLDRDSHVLRNSAILDGEIIRIDIGNFRRREKADSLAKHLLKETRELREWLITKAPQVVDTFDQMIEK